MHHVARLLRLLLLVHLLLVLVLVLLVLVLHWGRVYERGRSSEAVDIPILRLQMRRSCRRCGMKECVRLMLHEERRRQHRYGGDTSDSAAAGATARPRQRGGRKGQRWRCQQQ